MPTDPTPLTEQEREVLTSACGASGPAAEAGDGIAQVRCEGVEVGFRAAKAFYSERERTLRGALEFYAQESNHTPEWIGSEATGSSSSAVSRDKGQCARAALEASDAND